MKTMTTTVYFAGGTGRKDELFSKQHPIGSNE